MQFQLLYEDEDLVVIDKPEGYHVHKPEDRRIKVPREKICVGLLREQLGLPVSPVHRLDAATSGCMIWAKHKQAASLLAKQFSSERSVEKKYWALVRGWMPDEWTLDSPLELDSTGVPVDSLTRGKCLRRMEIHEPVGKRHSSARYSWLEAEPMTGRYRQIRRHMHRDGHPIVGDSDYGDAHHNRYFRDRWQMQGLFLRAIQLRFRQPISQRDIEIQAPEHPKWKALETLAQQFRVELS